LLLQGNAVTAYVANGAWDASWLPEHDQGVQVVSLEGGSTAAGIPTDKRVNSCAVDSATGEVVCTTNDADLYRITGTTLNQTLQSGASAILGFSDGTAMNTGVVIDAVNHRAVIGMGVTVSSSEVSPAFQFLDLGTNSFSAPIEMHTQNSVGPEYFAIDPLRNLVFTGIENYQAWLVDMASHPRDDIKRIFGPRSTGGQAATGTENGL